MFQFDNRCRNTRMQVVRLLHMQGEPVVAEPACVLIYTPAITAISQSRLNQRAFSSSASSQRIAGSAGPSTASTSCAVRPTSCAAALPCDCTTMPQASIQPCNV